jgi:hypothetical protein
MNTASKLKNITAVLIMVLAVVKALLLALTLFHVPVLGAASYEALASSLDQCTELVMILESGEEQGCVYITNAEEAQAYLTQMQEALESAIAE